MQSAVETTVVDTMVGPIAVTGDREYIRMIGFADRSDAAERDALTSPVLKDAVDQLKSYFSGRRFSFDLPLVFSGTDFQRRVWTIMQTIEYGQVRSYGDVARRLGNAGLARAVGQAANRNPVPIIVPCHRVVGANGAMVGFAAGVEVKKRLLDHERRFAGTENENTLKTRGRAFKA